MLRWPDDLRRPCDRVGPPSPANYWRTAVGAVATIQSYSIKRHSFEIGGLTTLTVNRRDAFALQYAESKM
jgi:hypothetical protein